MASWMGTLSTTDQVSPAASMVFFLLLISETGQISPFFIWCKAETTPVAPACLISASETGSLGPYHRHVCSKLKSLILNYTPLYALKPPTTGTTTPMTTDPPSQHSQSVVPIKSSGFPNLPIGVCSMIWFPLGVSEPSLCANNALFWPVRKNSVSRAFTRIPTFEKHTANHWVKFETAASFKSRTAILCLCLANAFARLLQSTTPAPVNTTIFYPSII